MGLPDDSWHLRYYEYSYLFYILFTVCIVLFYISVYCLKVPTRRFDNLTEILENDPVINSFRFRDKDKNQPIIGGQTAVPAHNLTSNRMKLKKEESVKAMYNQIISQQSRTTRNRKGKKKRESQEAKTISQMIEDIHEQLESSSALAADRDVEQIDAITITNDKGEITTEIH